MTLTTEQLRARAKFWREKAVEAKWESVSIAQDMLLNAEAFEELAANREAQPAALDVIARFKEWNTGFPVEKFKADYVIGWVLANYYAPPAPAVPEEISTRQAIVKMDSHEPCDSINVAYKLDWNACRAAMLAQPVSSGYKLPPHVYRELVNSLRDTAVKFSGTEQLRERLNTALSQFIEPDHPHTRTVAPEGGNG